MKKVKVQLKFVSEKKEGERDEGREGNGKREGGGEDGESDMSSRQVVGWMGE